MNQHKSHKIISKTDKSVQLGLVTRSLEIRADSVNEENRTIEIAFSSEAPYQRWFGIEVLSHKAEHVDMGFISSGNAPLLAGHSHDDQIGVIEKAWLQDGVGRAVVRFGKSNRASEYFQDVQDGIRKNVSVGYYVEQMELTKEGNKKTPDEYLVTKWKPVEVSFVAVPADETVGIRSADDEIETLIVRKKEPIKMEVEHTEAKTAAPTAHVFDVKAEREKERKRQADILAIGRMADMVAEAERAVGEDVSVADFRAKAFDKMVEKQAKPAVDMASLSVQDKKDIASYSFLKAVREAGEKNLTGIEKEMHQEAIKQFAATGVTSRGQLSIPYQVLATRDLSVTGSDAAGGYTVADELRAGSFIELLQNRMMVKAMGATVLDNLVGDIKIPTHATGATAAWEGENDANAESSPTFGQVALTPSRVGTYVEVSKQLLVQSSLAVENMVKMDIADSIALAVDYAALHGSGTGDQPLGIAATSGIGSVAGGTDGAAPSWANIIELETDVAVANADVGRMGYLTNAKVRGKLKQIFTNATYGEIPVWNNGTLNGYRAEVSNQVSSTLTKGGSGAVCSAIFFGNWGDLLLAFWGGLDMVVDPYTLATTNLTRITTNAYADVAVRHAASFSAMLDALTT